MKTPATLALLIAAALRLTNAQATCFVDKNATGSGAGDSWINAYPDLNLALSNDICSEIWIAKGVYKPTATADQSISFNIHPNTQVYGGFLGTETVRDARDPKINRTILSGDIDSNDSNYHSTSIDDTSDDIVGNNSFHVVVLDGTTTRGSVTNDNLIVDGIVITGGDATSGSSTLDQSGGGVLCIGTGAGNECSPTFRSVEFYGNHAIENGGAFYGVSGTGLISPVIEDCIFSGNSANFYGGAIYDDLTSGNGTLRLTGDVFRNNRATSSIGAVGHSGSDTAQLFITNSLFDGNRAWISGGVEFGGQRLVISNSTFQHNQATDSSIGALGYGSNDMPMSVMINDTTFYANFAKINAGAVLEVGSERLDSLYTNVTFVENSSGAAGGAMEFYGYNGATRPTFINTTFANNNAGTKGGALYGLAFGGGGFAANIYNSTFSKNSAADGGAIFNDADDGTGSLTIINSIFWGNLATSGNSQIGSSSVTPNIWSSIVADGCPSGSRCGSVLSSDPLLSELANHGGNTPTLLPNVGSPAIDSGDNSACPTSDQRGFDRSDGKCDIGATERQVIEDVIFKDGFAPLE